MLLGNNLVKIVIYPECADLLVKNIENGVVILSSVASGDSTCIRVRDGEEEEYVCAGFVVSREWIEPTGKIVILITRDTIAHLHKKETVTEICTAIKEISLQIKVVEQKCSEHGSNHLETIAEINKLQTSRYMPHLKQGFICVRMDSGGYRCKIK